MIDAEAGAGSGAAAKAAEKAADERADPERTDAVVQAPDREAAVVPASPPLPMASRLTLLFVVNVVLVVAAAGACALIGLPVIPCLVAGGLAGLIGAPTLARLF